MSKAVLLSLFFAFLSPILWSLMDLIDEYIVDNKSRHPIGFACIAGMINMAFGFVLSVFLDWDSSWRDYWPAAVSGIFLGIQFLLYFWMLKKDDVSNVIGFSYLYPIVVSLLSFFFLQEILSIPIYLGMGLIIFGISLIYLRALKTKLRLAIWVIISYALAIAFYEFFVKVATLHIPETNGLAVSSIFLGLSILPLIFFRNIRVEINHEMINFNWAILSEIFTISAVFATYLAMKSLPATVVSSLQATQPLLVVALEKIANKKGIMKSQDTNFFNKFIAIILIAAGVAIMYITEALTGE